MVRTALALLVLACACTQAREGNAPTPTPSAPASASASLNLHPAPDADRDAKIKKRFGEECRLERTCGALWGIDCNAAADGPYHYVRVTPGAFEEIATCGGACMGGRCTNCPPKNEGWTCPTY
jgi:hypothetical protein